MPEAVENAKFAMSIYDAAPKRVRVYAHEDLSADINWLYGHSSDPRPKHAQLPIPPGYEMPPLPWDDRYSRIEDIFGW